MTLATTPEDAEAFEALAALHEVEVSRVAFSHDADSMSNMVKNRLPCFQ